jgi:hypothetical protein
VNEPVLLEPTGALPTDQLGPLLKFVPVENVLIAAEAGMLTSQTIRANTGNVQFTPTGSRPDPTATHASLVPMVTTLDFIPARPDSCRPFLPNAHASDSGVRLRLARLSHNPHTNFCMQIAFQKASVVSERIDAPVVRSGKSSFFGN